ncbi:hypothetical protein ABL78_6405 [Leptomonas seymouri]|uniref:Uncharacterized protein n=1 Tax=Leptomonas seymouri TaxID=5684 RepID=A0A0N1I3E3_LEPSE|nr:hypothetical protein ABL78_6405 [Leptomonas seymouri]|eukprot:KPI84543.1 hypothetical protein ABL78_6405 [Leptomonas seymouri]
MFLDLVDMTLSYVQYLIILLQLDPDSVPDFFMVPFTKLQYLVLDVNSENFHNYLRVRLPDWISLDIRFQYICIAVICPLVVATLGMLFVHGKPAYIWLVCALGTLFMFLFGFTLLANLERFVVPGASLPTRETLGVLGGVGLPCFLLILAGGLLEMGRVRLQLLQRDATEMERVVEEERQRLCNQRVTQQMVNRDGIDLVAVAAERVHTQRNKDAAEHIDWVDLTLQGLFVILLFVGGLILLHAIKISSISSMQESTLFTLFGVVMMIVWGCVTCWLVLGFFKKGRQLLFAISNFVNQRCLGLIVTVCNLLYIDVVTNFISIMYCTPLECKEGTRPSFAASLFPSIASGTAAKASAGSTVGCLSCNYHAYPQRCSADWQRQLCAAPVRQRRLVYDPRVHCDNIDAFFKVSGSLIFSVYLIFTPYLQCYMSQYAVRVLKESYPLEQRYYDVFTPEEVYFQKVLLSQNNAAFAYRAYKQQFRFYRLLFLLQKLVLGVVGCVMRKGLDYDIAWVGMVFFLVVPLAAISCSLYWKPFARHVEAYYYIAVQAMLSVCAVVCLVSHQLRKAGMPTAVWTVLMVLLNVVPFVVLVIGNAVTLREERRWTELWQQRLVESVTAAYEDPAHRLSPPHHPNPHELKQDEAAVGLREDGRPRSHLTRSSRSPSNSAMSESDDDGAGVPSPSEKRSARGRDDDRVDDNENLMGEASLKAVVHLLTTPYAAAPALHSQSHADLRRVRQRRHSQCTSADYEDSSFVLPSAEESRSSVPCPHAAAAPPTTSTTPSRSPVLRHRGPQITRRSSVRFEDLPRHRTGIIATSVFAKLKLLRALPGPLNAETWGDTMKMVLYLAAQTITAPFSRAHRCSAVGSSLSATVPSRMRHSAGDISSARQMDDNCSGWNGRTGVAEEMEYTARHHSEGHDIAVASCRQRKAGAASTPLPTLIASSRPLAAAASTVAPQKHSVPGRSYSLPSVWRSGVMLSSPSQSRSSLIPSASPSFSQLSNGSPIANPLRVAQQDHHRISASLSPRNSPVSGMLHYPCPLSVALTTPPTSGVAPCVRKPAPLQQQCKNSRPCAIDIEKASDSPACREVHQASSALARPSSSASASALEDANEYARDATETFIPALYFAERARARRHSMLSRVRQGSVSLSSNAIHALHFANGNQFARGRHSSSSATKQVGEVRLPWKRVKNPEQQQSTAVAHPGLQDDASLLFNAEVDGNSATPIPSPINGNYAVGIDAVAPPSYDPSWRSAWRAIWMWILNVGDDAAKKRRSVLNFTDVYIRRQLCEQKKAEQQEKQVTHSSNHTSLVGDDVLAWTPAQLRCCARQVFWGSPTDAMLGVVEVPGSMPPWGLYCHAPPPPSSSRKAAAAAAATASTLDAQLQCLPLFLLQRQYYAQLAEEQREAALHAQDNRGSVLRCGGLRINADNEQGSAIPASPLPTFLPNVNFRFSQPTRPLRVAAYERQYAAVSAYHHDRIDSLLPVDTELDSFANAHDDKEDDSHNVAQSHNSGEADMSLSGTSALQRRKSGTLHWLQQWGPVLTELLYEAAIDDDQMGQPTQVNESIPGSVNVSDSDSSSSSSRTSLLSPMLSPLFSPRRRRRESGAHSHHSNKTVRQSWLRWLPCMPWSLPKTWKGKLCSLDDVTASPSLSTSPDLTEDSPFSRETRSHSRRGEASVKAPSTLLTLITHTHVAKSRRNSDATSLSRVVPSLCNTSYLDENESNGGSLRSNHVQWRGRRHRDLNSHSGDSDIVPETHLDSRTAVPGVTRDYSCDSVEQQQPGTPAVSPVAPQDPLIQQLRCLYLVRQRLKGSYWGHRKQLTAVQDYIDYEINETVQRILTFSFIVVGTVATISLALAILGMMHTMDWRFINGVRRTGGDLRYELAGYSSWGAFTENCCCIAAEKIQPSYPFYALDVENWVCANGVTKERVRRDGYDDVVVDGYAVRPLCGMTFQNGCNVAVDTVAQTASLTDCNTTVVTAASMLRW